MRIKTRSVSLRRLLFYAAMLASGVGFVVLTASLLISGGIGKLSGWAYSAITSANTVRAEFVSRELNELSVALSEVKNSIESNYSRYRNAVENGDYTDAQFLALDTDMSRFLSENSVSGVFLVLPEVRGQHAMHLVTAYKSGVFERPSLEYNPESEHGCWRTSSSVTGGNAQALVYSVPLIDESGQAAGVLGFELSLASLRILIGANDIPYNGSYYTLGTIDGESVTTAFGEIIPHKGLVASRNNLWQSKDSEPDMIISAVPLSISVSADDTLYVFALAEKMSVLELSRNFYILIAVSICASFIAACAVSFVLSKIITRKIAGSAEIVRGMGNASVSPENLPETHIIEVDYMLETIHNMGKSIIGNASRMSTIVDLMGLFIGGFEVSPSDGRVYVTQSMYRIINFDMRNSQGEGFGTPDFMPLWRFEECFPQYTQAHKDGKAITVFPLVKEGETRWLELRISDKNKESADTDETYIRGAVIDVTERVREKERLVYESNHDILTKLMNRKSYISSIRAMIEDQPDKCGILAFIDMDRLKRINDLYGHSAGDKYLSAAGKEFSVFNREGGVAARIAGDEFVIYLHGGDNPAVLKERLLSQISAIKNKHVEMPDGSVAKLVFSTGLAYYPKDSSSPDLLLKYADFAMYEIKKNSKGGIIEFDNVRYERSEITRERSSIVTAFISGREVRYAFQPIVNIKTGRVTMYEAIMRPMLEINHSPAEILEQAAAEGLLYELERFLFKHFCEWVYNYAEHLSGVYIGFNTIHGQYLSDEDFHRYARRFKSAGERGVTVVMEISASNYTDKQLLKRKIERARGVGMQVAIEGYKGSPDERNELFDLKPDYIKISSDIIRNLHLNEKDAAITEETVKIADELGIFIIAEGVETAEELKSIANLNIHYGQGFYFCPPEFKLVRELPSNIREEIAAVNN